MSESENIHPSNRRRNLRQHIEEFSSNTTLHGAHFVLGADKGIVRRVFWLLLILTGLVFLTIQLVASYEQLKSNDYVITKDIIDSSNQLKFPAITICNGNMMRKSRIEGTDAQVYLDQLNPFSKVLSLSNKTLDSSFDIEKAVLTYGHTADDLIDVCVWDEEFCSYRNFTTRFSHVYGLCHTFNSGRDGHPLLYSTSTRRNHGFHLMIDIDQDDYYGITSYINTGIRLVIHDQDEEPIVAVDGIDIMPGHITTMKIQREEYISLQPPFKSACGSRDLKTSNVYTQSRCLMECSTRKVIEHCGCKLLGMSELPEFNGTKYCKPYEMISCGVYANTSALNPETLGMDNLKEILFKYLITLDNSHSNEKCDCPKKCEQFQYKTTGINVMSLTSESFWSDYTKVILKKYSTVPQRLTEAYFK